MQWLRDAAGMIDSADAIEALAAKAAPAEGLYFVPAFTGLGAPYWDPEARGAILGLTRDSGTAEIVRAALDSVCYQTRDLMEAMRRDMKSAALKKLRRLKVDGGMVTNDWFCQRLADLTGLAVERPVITETTALGAAYLAGLGAGLFKDTKDIAARWALDRRFTPVMKRPERDKLYDGWKAAVKRVSQQLAMLHRSRPRRLRSTSTGPHAANRIFHKGRNVPTRPSHRSRRRTTPQRQRLRHLRASNEINSLSSFAAAPAARLS